MPSSSVPIAYISERNEKDFFFLFTSLTFSSRCAVTFQVRQQTRAPFPPLLMQRTEAAVLRFIWGFFPPVTTRTSRPCHKAPPCLLPNSAAAQMPVKITIFCWAVWSNLPLEAMLRLWLPTGTALSHGCCIQNFPEVWTWKIK